MTLVDVWAHEPVGIDAAFRAFSATPDTSHKRWTDNYLAAFALTVGADLATTDGKLSARYPAIRVHTIA